VNAGSEDNRIAIIGMAARVPGARDVEEFWANLVGGVESLTELTDEILRDHGVPEERIADPHYVRLAPLIDGMEEFDAAYFRFSPREAEISDPQQRIFLEICDTAMQHAGYDVSTYHARVGVFGGGSPNRYATGNVYANARAKRAVSEIAIEVGNQMDYLATRVAYTLGLSGPAVSVATACSTSLVALHLAARSLLAGECGMALAGGVSVELPYYAGRRWTENSIYSRDGHVRAFDAEAQGTNFGHGAGAVVLKRYADAVADGDHVYAVVLGSAMNNDGARRVGFTAPGLEGQTALISSSLGAAGVEASSIGLVEAHGTATLVGDPIEVAALSEAYRLAGVTGNQLIPIGSVKTNIGHLGPAAGAAGLIKAVLAVDRGQLPASLNFDTPNPRIGFERTPFYVNDTLAPWPERSAPRRAAVSSFGIGGTNVHVIIEQAPPAPPAEASTSWQVLPLSAKTASALARMRQNLADHLAADPSASLPDIAHTLQIGRPALEHRTALACRDVDDAVAKLRAPVPETTPVRPGTQPAVVFMFPGQGAQHLGMAETLYRDEPVFRAAFDECADHAREPLGEDLRAAVFADPSRSDADRGDRLRQTRLAQPALFAVEYALAQLWLSRGVHPWAMVGHSVGEFVAACLAEVFTLAEAIEIVVARGRLMQSMPPGVMLAVPLPEAEVYASLGAGMGVAAVNTHSSCVVAGPSDEVAAFAGRLAEGGATTQELRTSHAFHSPMMDPIRDAFLDVVTRVGPKPPTREFVSTLTGTWIRPEEAINPRYWVDHLRDTVRFAEACTTVAGDDALLLEVGPGQTLTSLARQVLAELPGTKSIAVPSLARADGRRGDDEQLAETVARLWTAGVTPSWTALHHGRRSRVALPTYPYERRRFWIDADPEVDPAPAEPRRGAPSNGHTFPAADSTFVPVWRQERHTTPPVPIADGDVWLVFSPGEGPVEEVASRLAAAGALVVRVAEGRGFRSLGERRYRMEPGDRADYVALLDEVGARYGRPTTVVHGWTAKPAAAAVTDPSVVEDAQESGFFSLLFLTQALTELWPDDQVDVRVVTSNCFNVSGAEPVEPAKSLLVGPTMVVPTELPLTRTQLVDVSRATPGRDTVDLAALVTELTTPIVDRLVAHRGRLRWIAEYEPLPLSSRAASVPRIRPGGAYLVTGGFGGLGLTVAKELARTAQARIVLVGRSALPPRPAWDDHLATHGEDDPISERIRGVREVEALGGTVMTAAADVCDESAMRAVIQSVHERFGRLDGVIHAAGVPGGGLAAVRSRPQAEEVLAPKVRGTLVLDRLLGAEVDLFVLFSSIIAVTGDFGMVDYCAANAFMDAFAQASAGRRARTLAINWCGWTDVGMIGNTRQNAPQVFRDLEAGLRYEPAAHPLLDRRVHGLGDDLVFATTINPDFHWVITEHRMGGNPVLPGTAYVELIRAAFVEAHGDVPVALTDLVFSRPLVVEGRREMRVVGHEREPGVLDFQVVSRPVDDATAPWETHARGQATAAAPETPPRRDLAAIERRCDLLTWRPDLNGKDSGAVEFGPRWLNVETVRMGDGEQLVTIQLPQVAHPDCAEFVLHPAALDGATALGLYLPEVTLGGRSFLPLGYARILTRAPLPPRFYSHMRDRSARTGTSGIFTFDVELLDETGRVLATIEGFSVRTVDVAAVHDALSGVAEAAAPAVSPESIGAQPVRADDYCVTPAEGVELLWRMLDDATPSQVVVSREPIHEKIARMSGLAAQLDQASAAVPLTDQGGALPRPAVDVDATAIEATILALWQEVLGTGQIALDDDFFDLGGNSLVAVHLAVRMRERFGVNVAGITILEHATVRALAPRVEEAIAIAVDGRSAGDEGVQR
jgi:acyl transferase domain-containing protein